MLIQLLFWPAIAVAVLLSVIGIIRRDPLWLIAGVPFSLPSTFYLLATPRFSFVALFLPACLLAAAFAVRHGKIAVAWLFFAPFAGFFGWLAWLVINQ
ncbi:MAG: hypothetical protein IBX47_11045 [Desulfuromonadales bacterium]|nr:hypothetical protein [Desulfuromonadales bacterium]